MPVKKEILACNKPRDTVFIGVGGIGSGIVASLAARCGEEESKTLRFAVMDTDVNDLKQMKAANSNITAIQTSSTQSVGDYLEKDEDARLNWFPNNTILYPKTVSDGAGQVRAISRLALDMTVKSGEILQLYQTIDSLFHKDGRDLKQALNIVIVSTAAGGTGSGIAMAVAMLVRKYLEKQYPETKPWIRGYIVLPGVLETVITTETERESLRRNGYATIKEINAFMMMGSGFCGTEKALSRYSGLAVKVPATAGVYETLNTLPFDFCFLLDRVDANQGNMETLDDYLNFAAQSLYELSVGPMQKAISSQEDNIIKEIAKKDNLGRNRFAGAGASVLRYPYESVVDYIAFTRAIDKIGENEEKSWLRYDLKFKEKCAEFKKRRALESDLEEPKIEVVYPELLNDEKDDNAFGKEIRSSYLLGREEDSLQTSRQRVEEQIGALKRAILDELYHLPNFLPYSQLVKTMKGGDVFAGADSRHRGTASGKRDDIEAFYALIKSAVRKKAKGVSESVFRNEKPLAGNFENFHIESLLKNGDGGIHPTAMRFNLYVLNAFMREESKNAEDSISACGKRINDYLRGEGDAIDFDVKGSGIFKEKEDSLNALCTLDASNDDPNVLQRWGGYDNLYKKLDEVFSGLSSAIDKLLNSTIEAAIYEIGLPYVSALCKELERFYETFSSKVIKLNEKKNKIVEDLSFKNGSVTLNVCCGREHLDQLEQRAPQARIGLLLPGELNSQLFDAVKKNVAIRKEKALDPYSDAKVIDLFDDILIDFFREVIREDCGDVINMNVIDAVKKEYALDTFADAQLHNANNEEEIEVIYSETDRDAHVRSRIQKCRALASPGIIMRKFEEARTIQAISCNTSVMEALSAYGDENGRPAPSDTVSRYELR
ncbi:MAG: tubulin-like doman-containing protein, partial [Clostridiales bacterium]|nr:tubulin-like doman-containing protein [Clostridiales bacterium]